MEKYERIRVIGRGAYGTVYLTKRIHDGKLVIVKQIPVEQMTKDERQAALNEVKVLSMLSHPNIIEYYENYLEDKALMIVMEYAQGGTLFEYIQQRNGNLMEEEDILKFFVQMLLSLHHVHSKQILHRDLKTQNILLDKKKAVVKIGDFGISKVLSSKSKAYTVVGTPCYISPELCEGKPYNQKSDIWALGCVLYEIASLKRAFEAANLPALVLKIMRGTFAPISEHYSEELRSLILSMLHLDPNKRPNINQIMAQPIVINHLMNLYTDMGKVPSTRIHHPINVSSTKVNKQKRVAIASQQKGTTQSIMSESEVVKYFTHCSIFTWGNGINTPFQLPLPSAEIEITQVAAGRTQKAAVTKSGRVIIWEVSSIDSESPLPGSSYVGPTYIPRFLEGQSAVTIQHVACGDLFTACLTDRGIMMTFGSGANGCLGHGNFHDISHAKIVEALLGYEVAQVSCGASHVLAVTNDHEVFAWGRGEHGRLGLGNNESWSVPQLVVVNGDFEPQSVQCGVDCSIMITTGGRLLCCGSNRFNKLALNGEEQESVGANYFTPVSSRGFDDLKTKSVAIGTSHTAVVTECGQCYTFGSNQFGQLGHDNPYPSIVPTLPTEDITMVSCGDTFTTAVTNDGKIYSWGKKSRGRLGRGNENITTPSEVKLPVKEIFVVVDMSSSHSSTLAATKPVNRLVLNAQMPVENHKPTQHISTITGTQSDDLETVYEVH
ncbi:serine/threonine-protein kinase Nek8-like [Tubulanus polymorphus]|uniref:serine/threonine-protein kinase Nek8-like n=1 Tax=Tubulanus polymorphus TaxID=672921 RepID=UPI003DA573D4